MNMCVCVCVCVYISYFIYVHNSILYLRLLWVYLDIFSKIELKLICLMSI